LQLIKSASTIFFNTQKKSSFYIQNSNESKFLKKLKSTKYIILTEVFSTTASIQMAFPYQLVACSFDYGNILHVVSSFIEKNPKLIIILCGDRDFKSKAGEKALIETNSKFQKNTIIILPKFKDEEKQLSDFNDLQF